MLQKMIMLGIVAGVAMAVPFVHSQHPGLYKAMVARAFAPPPAEATAPAALSVATVRPTVSASGRTVEIAPDPRGHFTAEFRLNGQRVDAMVDTGASVVAINETTARRIGISLSPADFRHEVNTANGIIKAASASLDRIEIGRIRVRDVTAVVLADEALSTTLIGMSFLNRLHSYGVEEGRLLLEK